jgi:hypothetical protein
MIRTHNSSGETAPGPECECDPLKITLSSDNEKPFIAVSNMTIEAYYDVTYLSLGHCKSFLKQRAVCSDSIHRQKAESVQLN